MSDENDRCEDCGRKPVGVTMHPEMEGWSCPYCGHYNEFDGSLVTDGGSSESASTVYAGGLGSGATDADEYCLIVGETSLCNKLYRRLGHQNGADFAVTWDYEVTSPDDAPRGTELCRDCRKEGGWDAVPTTDAEQSQESRQ